MRTEDDKEQFTAEVGALAAVGAEDYKGKLNFELLTNNILQLSVDITECKILVQTFI